MIQHVKKPRCQTGEPLFWRDEALPFIEARFVEDGRKVCYAKHWHETFSIGLIARGRCNYVNGRKASQASQGTVVLMNPGDAHACNPIRGERWSYKMLYLDVPWLAAVQSADDSDRVRTFLPFSEVASSQGVLYTGLNRLFDTLCHSRMAALEKQTASVLFMELLQRCLGATRSRLRSPPRLTRALEYIRAHATRSLSLEEICTAAELSASHLIRAFKKNYGLTPHAFQLNCRIEFGRSQLRTGRPIAEVALAAGFSDQAHFQRTFKRFVAATPGQYRAHVR